MADPKTKIRTFAFVVLLILGGVFVMTTSAQTNRTSETFSNETIQITTTYQDLDGSSLSNVQNVTDTTVENTSTGTEYELGTDYEIDEANVSIRRTTSGSISANEEVDVSYTVEYYTERQDWGVGAVQTVWGIAALLILVAGASFLLVAVFGFASGSSGGRRRGGGR